MPPPQKPKLNKKSAQWKGQKKWTKSYLVEKSHSDKDRDTLPETKPKSEKKSCDGKFKDPKNLKHGN